MILSENYRIISEENNTVLQYFKDKIKTKKNGDQEPYVFVENYYYPNLKTALQSYVNKSISECREVSSVLLKLNKLEKEIKLLLTK
tara:strand:- start:226 stop:483 length:258 start_codon:yes stop_codon:yes gene_type:complete